MHLDGAHGSVLSLEHGVPPVDGRVRAPGTLVRLTALYYERDFVVLRPHIHAPVLKNLRHRCIYDGRQRVLVTVPLHWDANVNLHHARADDVGSRRGHHVQLAVRTVRHLGVERDSVPPRTEEFVAEHVRAVARHGIRRHHAHDQQGNVARHGGEAGHPAPRARTDLEGVERIRIGYYDGLCVARVKVGGSEKDRFAADERTLPDLVTYPLLGCSHDRIRTSIVAFAVKPDFEATTVIRETYKFHHV
mmetsp:Transcript_42747/g.84006  ORF Transcript_42747/g.84006 Transcript_42747/m.84006 type:complete len:247 (-) Transcript_42747:217-957(-)